MPKQIKLKTSIAVPGVAADVTTLPEHVNTIRDLLIEIGGRIKFDFIDSGSGDLVQDIEIVINGKEVWFYPRGLDACLEDGDAVEIHLIALGGG